MKSVSGSDIRELMASMEDERRNAAKAFNDRCGALEMTLDQLEKQIVKVHFYPFTLQFVMNIS